MTASTSGAFTRESSGANKRKRRGFFDFVLVLALGYGVYAKTPIGAVVETAVRAARGQKDHPSWFATFKGRETAVAAPTVDTNVMTTSTLPPAVEAAALKHKIDVDALASLLAVRGACDAAGKCTMQAPDKLAYFVPGGAGSVDVDVVAQGLAKAAIEVPTKDAQLQIEALFTGPHALNLALEQAKRSNLEAPDDVEVHAPFFSPGTRRGPLQGALSVLLVHRLRTLAWPAKGFRITSPFGERIHPVTGLKSFHNGTDVGTPVGTPLHSAHNGSIKRASKDSISGNYVIVDHGLGVQTTYCHMDSFVVSEKQRIQRAGVLGDSGATGRITGPHLHYILRINDKAVDAEQYGQSPTRAGGLTPVVPEKKDVKKEKPPEKKEPKKKDPKKAEEKKPEETKPEEVVAPPPDPPPADPPPADPPPAAPPADAPPPADSSTTIPP